MADFDPEYGTDDESGAKSPENGHSRNDRRGGNFFSVLASRRMVILQTAIAVVIFASLGFWIYLMRQPPKQPIQSAAAVAGQGQGETQPGEAGEAVSADSAEPQAEEKAPMIEIPAVKTAAVADERPAGEMTAAEAREIASMRSEMRRSNRSERNQTFTRRMNDDDLLKISIRGELALLSSMFTHYVSTTGKFYELFRIMSNGYVPQREQVLEIFEKQLLPEYNVTERRRRMMRRRVEHDPAVELYDRLDYIAYHDSIAVYSFREFIEKGGEEQFAQTSDLVSESKFMMEDFRQRLENRLKDYDMKVEVPEAVWQKYFGRWPW